MGFVKRKPKIILQGSKGGRLMTLLGTSVLVTFWWKSPLILLSLQLMNLVCEHLRHMKMEAACTSETLVL
jgi:hypothetical protein